MTPWVFTVCLAPKRGAREYGAPERAIGSGLVSEGVVGVKVKR